MGDEDGEVDPELQGGGKVDRIERPEARIGQSAGRHEEVDLEPHDIAPRQQRVDSVVGVREPEPVVETAEFDVGEFRGHDGIGGAQQGDGCRALRLDESA